MEFSLVYASKVIMERDFERIAQEQIDAMKAEEELEKQREDEKIAKVKAGML